MPNPWRVCHGLGSRPLGLLAVSALALAGLLEPVASGCELTSGVRRAGAQPRGGHGQEGWRTGQRALVMGGMRVCGGEEAPPCLSLRFGMRSRTKMFGDLPSIFLA